MEEETKRPGKSRRRKEEEPFDLKKEIISWIQIIVAAVVIAFFLTPFIIANSRIPTGSMEPTIMSHSRVIGSRLSYLADDPERGDVVIFHYPDDPSGKTYFVKRVIGLPGETIQIIDGMIYINDELYLEEADYPAINDPGMAAEPITLGSDEYFVLGDNRNDSQDSRFADVGNVRRSYIEGRVWLVLAPRNDFGLVS